MSVVQRCPNCGTTSATSGECEACHGAEVRYFCTNHTPGVWLDAPACPRCGGRVGALPRSASAPPPVPTARKPAPARRAPAPAPAPAPPDLVAAPSRTPLWPTLVKAALRARYLPAAAARGRERPLLPGVGGCLKGLVLLVVLLFLSIVIGGFLFGRVLLYGY
jgi:hypothetical protein